jgi:hypothetical protein
MQMSSQLSAFIKRVVHVECRRIRLYETSDIEHARRIVKDVFSSSDSLASRHWKKAERQITRYIAKRMNPLDFIPDMTDMIVDAIATEHHVDILTRAEIWKIINADLYELCDDIKG